MCTYNGRLWMDWEEQRLLVKHIYGNMGYLSKVRLKEFREICRDCGSSSTFHGVPRITKYGRSARGVFWIAVFTLAMGWAIIGSGLLLDRYLSYPVSTTVKMVFNDVNFPAVTFCNLNNVRGSQISLAGSEFEQMVNGFDESLNEQMSGTRKRRRRSLFSKDAIENSVTKVLDKRSGMRSPGLHDAENKVYVTKETSDYIQKPSLGHKHRNKREACPGSYYTHPDGSTSCFYFSSGTASYSSARSTCIRDGGRLAHIYDSNVNAFVVGISTSTSDHWIGLTKIGSGWYWEGEDQPVTWNNWIHAAHEYNCVYNDWYSLTFHWHNLNTCTTSKLYLCEIYDFIIETTTIPITSAVDTTSVVITTVPDTTTLPMTTAGETTSVVFTTTVETTSIATTDRSQTTVPETTTDLFTTLDDYSTSLETTFRGSTSFNSSTQHSQVQSTTRTALTVQTSTTPGIHKDSSNLVQEAEEITTSSDIQEVDPSDLPFLPEVDLTDKPWFDTDAPVSVNVQNAETFQNVMSTIDTETRSAMGHQLDTMLDECKWNGQACNGSYFSSTNDKVYGNCYTFNSGSNGDVLTSSKSGQAYGLSMVLYIEQSEYIGSLSQSAGVRLLLHPQNEQPFPGEQGFEISPGRQTSLSITLTKYLNLEPPFNDCNDVDLISGGTTYTKKECENQCIHLEILKNCSCADSFYGGNQTQKACTEEDIDCTSAVVTNFLNNNLQCDCKDPCSGERYSVALSTSEWPGSLYEEQLTSQLLRENPGLETDFKDSDYVRKNFLKVDIFYDEVRYEETAQHSMYPIAKLISDVGGHIALYAGISMLSVFELIVLCIQLSIASCKRVTNPTESILERRAQMIKEEENSLRLFHRHRFEGSENIIDRRLRMMTEEGERLNAWM